MKLGALSLFAKTNSRRTFNLAAYHSPHSLTWSWILSLGFDRSWRKANGWPRFVLSVYRTNGGPQWVVLLPFVSLHWHRQREMWFRDLFRKAREREDALERAVSRLGQELAQVRSLANTPTEVAQ
ncbi:hypothetical protein [Phenylobacterium sp.]|uniref:hypothetical protein n=1 Tax=Phenylobacterium sp. TaxID=1871053 RepID=UPI0035B4BE5A